MEGESERERIPNVSGGPSCVSHKDTEVKLAAWRI